MELQPRIHQRLLRPCAVKLAPLIFSALRRNYNRDHAALKLGKREIVGYGFNGSPSYADRLDFPMPAIRFQEPNKDICALREKELCDWKKLSLDEKKALYRYSFCQTFAEIKAPTGDWKFPVAMAFWILALACFMPIPYYTFLYDRVPKPATLEEPRRRAQLKRIIALEMNPIQGIASHWDYDNRRWKK